MCQKEGGGMCENVHSLYVERHLQIELKERIDQNEILKCNKKLENRNILI
jgi:hypothetical protein